MPRAPVHRLAVSLVPELRLIFAVLAALTATVAQGENALPLVSAAPPGYVFDQPRILTQQRLFGLAHGISLLADRCFDQPAHGEEVRQAYAAWHQQQAATIALAQDELARYYFGERADDAAWLDIVTALGLKNSLSLKSGSPKLKAACATLAQALGRYHNDLAAQFELQVKLDRLTVAAVTEAQAEACKVLLTGEATTALAAGIDAWRQQHSAALGEARQAVEQRWQEAHLEGSFDHWLNQARSSGRHKATADRCEGLTTWLATPAADPDAPFKPKS